MHFAFCEPSDRTTLSRRQFLAATSAGILGAGVTLKCLAAQVLPAPRFVLEWGKNGKAPGEFSANHGSRARHKPNAAAGRCCAQKALASDAVPTAQTLPLA